MAERNRRRRISCVWSNFGGNSGELSSGVIPWLIGALGTPLLSETDTWIRTNIWDDNNKHDILINIWDVSIFHKREIHVVIFYRLIIISLKCLHCGWTIRFWEEIETKSQYSNIGWWDISVLDSFSKERFNQSFWDTFGKLLEVHGRPCNWRSLQEGFNSYEN